MKDLWRAWFWGGASLAVLLVLSGRMLTSGGSLAPLPLSLLMTMIGFGAALAAAVAHPAPSRRSLRRFVRAVAPLVVVPGLLDGLAVLSAGGTVVTALVGIVTMSVGGAVGAWVGARALPPRPERGFEWYPIGPTRHRGPVLYGGVAGHEGAGGAAHVSETNGGL